MYLKYVNIICVRFISVPENFIGKIRSSLHPEISVINGTDGTFFIHRVPVARRIPRAGGKTMKEIKSLGSVYKRCPLGGGGRG